ncbi:type IV toxin-antitoxin system AbiEi family antitoxin domain-containing protein [Kribbella sp. GL6]|uniref:type IV toxin-antitoxin system AbiEi family antitoxin domain-containing protein n=1 Tax=Kribbella sp. GL6 TaxID=3419765 RepID=UPI003D063585
MESLAEILGRQGGWATFSDLTALVSRKTVSAALARGDVQRVGRGIYALPELPAGIAAALSYDGVVSHSSAAAAMGFPLLVAPEKPHVIVPPNRHSRPGPPAVLHWADTDTDERRNRITSPLRTVVDAARILPFGEGLAVADAALATGRISQDELLAATVVMRGYGCPNARAVAEAASGLSGSFLESMLRALLISAGIEGFEPQVLVCGGSFRARVDLGHRRARLALEADSFEFHGSRRHFTADCLRYDELVAAGWLVLRLTYEQVIGDPDWVVAMVRSVLAQRLAG